MSLSLYVSWNEYHASLRNTEIRFSRLVFSLLTATNNDSRWLIDWWDNKNRKPIRFRSFRFRFLKLSIRVDSLFDSFDSSRFFFRSHRFGSIPFFDSTVRFDFLDPNRLESEFGACLVPAFFSFWNDLRCCFLSTINKSSVHLEVSSFWTDRKPTQKAVYLRWPSLSRQSYSDYIVT